MRWGARCKHIKLWRECVGGGESLESDVLVQYLSSTSWVAVCSLKLLFVHVVARQLGVGWSSGELGFKDSLIWTPFLTWVPKTGLIGKQALKEPRFSQSIRNLRRFQKCKSKNREQRAFWDKALFLTFPNEKTTFQGSEVVSEAICPTNRGYTFVLGSDFRFSFRAPEVPDLRARERRLLLSTVVRVVEESTLLDGLGHL